MLKYVKLKLKTFALKKIKNNYVSNDSYSLVTGCTSGLGKAYVDLIAQTGSNLILVSRNELKLKELEAQLKFKFKDIKILTVSLDLSKDSNYLNESYLKIKNMLKDKDINILVNNVGKSNLGGNFDRYSIEEHKSIINVNILSHVLFSQLFIETQLNKRTEKRLAIINVSSYYGTKSIPGQAIYSATKAFINNFSQSLNFEIANRQSNLNAVDVLCLTPLYIKTNMVKLPLSFYVLDPEDVVIASFLRLRLLKNSHSNWRHSIHSFLLNLMPYSLFNKKMYKKYEGYYKRLQEAKQRRLNKL